MHSHACMHHHPTPTQGAGGLFHPSTSLKLFRLIRHQSADTRILACMKVETYSICMRIPGFGCGREQAGIAIASNSLMLPFKRTRHERAVDYTPLSKKARPD
jgi:hypothetical protein